MSEVKICGHCGKPLDTNLKYCGRECREAARKIMNAERQKELRAENRQYKNAAKATKEKRKSNAKSIADINAKALASGMSYGKYVAMMGIR